MEIAQLKGFLAVMELESLSKAAHRLGITQPAVSRYIRLLEEELGEKLFLRHGRGMIATDMARRVAERASRAMSELREISSDVADSVGTPVGTVALGLPPTVADMIIVPAMAVLSRSYPGIRLKFFTAFSGHLLDWLHAGEIDVGVLYDPSRYHSLSAQPLLKEELVFVSRAHRKLSLGHPVSLQTAAQDPLLLPSIRHGIRKMVDAEFVKLDLSPNIPIEADSLPVLKELVLAGHGSTILPLSSVLSEVRNGLLSVARLAPSLHRNLVLARSADHQLSNAGKAVCKVLGDVFHAEVESGRLAADMLVDVRTFHGRI